MGTKPSFLIADGKAVSDSAGQRLPKYIDEQTLPQDYIVVHQLTVAASMMLWCVGHDQTT